MFAQIELRAPLGVALFGIDDRQMCKSSERQAPAERLPFIWTEKKFIHRIATKRERVFFLSRWATRNK